MKQKLFVISMDAMVREDIDYMLTKPNFQKIFGKRAEVMKVRSVYPASTYPAHTTLMTGCYPNKHGVYSNFSLKTVDDGISHWPVESSRIFAEDLFAAAKREGRTTAAVFWPITGNNPNIDHVINEYFFYYPNEDDRIEETFAAQGADEVALQAVRENLHLFPKAKGKRTSEEVRFDDFLMGCACSLIRNAKPDLLLVHNSWPDTNRHKEGAFSRLMPAVLDQVDEWLGDVAKAMEDAGVYEDTNFVLLSDHGQRDCTKAVNLNVIFEKEGLIQLAPDGTIYTWLAYAQTNGMSTTVYLSDNTNEKLYARVHAILKKLQENDEYGIERIWTREELAEAYHQSGPYSFMVEAVESTLFTNAIAGDATTEIPTKGSHGYMPEKGPQPIFMGRGPAFRENASIENANLVDIAPTLATILGVSLPEADGIALTELLK